MTDLFRRIMRCFELKAYRVRRISKMASRHALCGRSRPSRKSNGEQRRRGWLHQQISQLVLP